MRQSRKNHNDDTSGVATIDASAETPSVQSVDETRPSVHTASFHQQSFHSVETNSTNDEAATVSADQERQVLLLMLLAQVCALHDPTPKTFTIHVVELFERGILDRESIHFLFELGLVPSISPTITRNLLTAAEMAVHGNVSTTDSASQGISEISSEASDPITTAACQEITNELALTTTTTTTTNVTSKLAAVFAASGDPQRSAEAYAIRATLAQYEQLQHNRSSEGGDDPTLDNKTNNPHQPWDAKHFPLSLSRYQREFVQIALLASGSFGQVFHATRKMDGCDYAIKKVDFDATGYSNETIQEVVREVECLAKVSDHPNVVRYYTSWLEPSWMTGGQAVETTASVSSPSGSPTRGQRRSRRQQQQHHRLLLTNPLQDLMNPGSVSDNHLMHPSETSYESSRFYDYGGGESFLSQEASSSGVWQRPRRFSFESSVESGDQSWESYHDQSLEDLERGSIGDDSSSSILFMEHGHNRQDLPNHRHRPPKGGRNHTKPMYRYQISLYIQMQLCHPASLADWIRERNSKVPERNYKERIPAALDIFEQIVEGLAHVHEKGIIHRDLKPANIFASKDGQVIKIGDFGLSKQLVNMPHSSSSSEVYNNDSKLTPDSREDDSSHPHHKHWHNATNGAIVPKRTSATTITNFRKAITPKDLLLTAGIGTRSYAAPEQISTKTYSTSADIFSLGLIFLELVCCFETEHERLHNFQQCRQQQGVQPWLSDNYPEIANIILACTQPDPSQRPSAKAILGMLSARRIQYSSTSLVPFSESPKGDLHHALLRRSLERRDVELEQQRKELVEKDKVIEKLRREMERMKSSLSASDSLPQEDDDDQIEFID